MASPFPSVFDLPMVARRSALERAEAKRRLGLDPQQPTVLVSFGGLGPSAIDTDALMQTDGYTFVVTPPGPRAAAPNLRCVDTAEMTDRGLRFEDLVRACDVVASKPGYGIVSECIANETRLLYTSRGAFAEYPVLVDGIETHGVAGFIDNATLASGRWGPALDALVAQPARICRLPTNGAEVAARALLERLP